VAEEVYHRLRKQLDQYSCGFPTTPSGVELKILEKIFSEEEAEMFLQMSVMLEAPEEVGRRTGREPKAVGTLLSRMAEKGQLFQWRREDSVKYAAVPFVLGMYEFQLKNMDRELAELCDRFFDEGLLDTMTRVDPLMRTIPVNKAVEVSHPIATYDDSRAIIQGKKLIAVSNCICRMERGLLDKACDKPLEVCMQFGATAQYFIDRGMARKISTQEALSILDRCEEAGLVTQPANAKNPGGLCNCCGDCCAILRALNRLPRPADHVLSNYFAVVDAQACVGCETCLDRCPMGAIRIEDDQVAKIERQRCIGCGLCVSTCPEEAIHLDLKPENQRRMPPETVMDAEKAMAQARGTSLMPLSESQPR